MITLTPKAAEELVKILEARGADESIGLRLGVTRGGCAGWQYEMTVAAAEEGDHLSTTAGARLIVAADSIEKLKGCQVDYSDDLTDAGFKIINPQAARSCGCGTSFESTDEPQAVPHEDGDVCGTP